MKLFARTLAVAAALFACNAHATVFNFSYKFGDNQTISGNLTGTQSGNFINNIGNLHVFFDNVAFTGTLVASGYDGSNFNTAIAPKLSTVATLNNFMFSDGSGVNAGIDNWFYFVNGPTLADQQVFANNFNTGAVAFDGPANASWSLTAGVPEPASIVLVLTGLTLLGAATQRRR